MEPFVGQIMMAGFKFAPEGWAFCDGQLIPISNNQALYSLLGTRYGGNGRTTFALPDLCGRAPISQGDGPGLTPHRNGEKGGQESVYLDVMQLPPHDHSGMVHPRASNQVADESSPTDHFPAVETTGRNQVEGYRPDYNTEMGPSPFTTSTTGRGQAHSNMQPYAVVNFIIALWGIYPSRS